MDKASNKVWLRVGVEPEARLRWLLGFGNLAPDSLTAAKRSAVVQEARAFVILQQVDPALRSKMRFAPAPTDATPNVLTRDETWSAQGWLKQGLDLLSRSQKWNFMPCITYELDAYRGLFWARMTAPRVWSYSKPWHMTRYAMRGSNFAVVWSANDHLYRSGARDIVPRAALRTRKWRKAHPEKNREIRRLQYRRSVTAKFRRALISARILNT
jgi:hypothetical protein